MSRSASSNVSEDLSVRLERGAVSWVGRKLLRHEPEDERSCKKVAVVVGRGKSSCEGRIRTVPEDSIGDHHGGRPSTMTQVRRNVEDHGPIETIKKDVSRQ